MAPGKVNINGTWKDVAEVSAKVNGAWKEVIEAYSKVNGTWQQWFELIQSVAFYMTTGSNFSPTRVYKWNFATAAVSRTTDLNGQHQNTYGWSNRGVAGYMEEGSKVVRLQFPTDVKTFASPPLQSLNLGAATENPGVSGYVHAGNFSDKVLKHSFPAETWSYVDPMPTTSTEWNAAMSNGNISAYIHRGNYSDDIYKWDFATGTQTASILSTGVGSFQNAGWSNYGVAGYFTGSNNSSSTVKINFSTDSDSVLNGFLQTFLDQATEDPTIAGYIADGFEGDVFKQAYPTETLSSYTSAPGRLRGGGAFADA